MNVSGPDVHQILEYRADTALARMLPTGLGLCFLGLLGLAVLDAGHRDFEFILAVGVLLTVGPGIIALALFKRANRGKPIFVLSPMGIHYRIPWVKEFLIPWREIRGIETIDVTSSNWSFRNPGTVTFHNVTVILVPKPFYNARIFVDSLLLRGPGWENNFIPKGDLVQVALRTGVGRTADTPRSGRGAMAGVPQSAVARAVRRRGRGPIENNKRAGDGQMEKGDPPKRRASPGNRDGR